MLTEVHFAGNTSVTNISFSHCGITIFIEKDHLNTPYANEETAENHKVLKCISCKLRATLEHPPLFNWAFDFLAFTLKRLPEAQ